MGGHHVSQDDPGADGPRPASQPVAPSLAFSLGEYKRRFAAAEAAVAEARLDAFLSTILGNICWVSGFQTLASYSFALYGLLIQPGRPPVLVSSDFEIVPIVTSGRRSGIPHTTFRRVRLEAGDPVFIEVCGTYQRYSAPMLRTASIGEPAPEIRRAFDTCRASVEALIAEIRPGVA